MAQPECPGGGAGGEAGAQKRRLGFHLSGEKENHLLLCIYAV